ncbi:MAG TPA: hypothetical protein VEK15_17125, partial [Vicinamibacteria bacterium]|nr:hypothetical protein [Vicinamibacteria bacterium]
GRVRTSRANARLADSVKLNVSVKTLDEALGGHLAETKPVLIALSNLASLTLVRERPAGTIAFVDPAFELYIDLGAHVDIESERKRIDKEIAEAQKKLEQVEKKLQNPKFLAGAKPEVVEAQRQKDEELREIIGKLGNLKRELSGIGT